MTDIQRKASKRKLSTITHKNVEVKIYFDSDLKEYSVEMWKDRRFHAGAVYFTDDKEDAISTAHFMLELNTKGNK